MKIPFLDLKRSHNYLNKEISAALSRVHNSGEYILGNEVEKFEALREELRSDGQLLTIEEYIQKIDARYENRFAELENNWLVLERLKPELQKPDFVKAENRRLPDLPIQNKYKQVRG